MVLAVDIGNTNIVVGCFERDKIRFIERMSTDRNRTTLEYVVLIRTVLELYDMECQEFEGGILSSVVPQATEPVRQAVAKVTGKPVLLVNPGMQTGFKNCLYNPAQLGSDRVADAVAATHGYPCPQIIVDMGTATTVSVIDGEKNFLGGVIMPGLKGSLESLTCKTAQLPAISFAAPERVIGANTVSCMQSGMVYGMAGAVDGVIDRIESELGCSCTRISTGGLANLIVPNCRHSFILDEQLLLKGLMLLYQMNQGSAFT